MSNGDILREFNEVLNGLGSAPKRSRGPGSGAAAAAAVGPASNGPLPSRPGPNAAAAASIPIQPQQPPSRRVVPNYSASEQLAETLARITGDTKYPNSFQSNNTTTATSANMAAAARADPVMSAVNGSIPATTTLPNNTHGHGGMSALNTASASSISQPPTSFFKRHGLKIGLFIAAAIIGIIIFMIVRSQRLLEKKKKNSVGGSADTGAPPSSTSVKRHPPNSHRSPEEDDGELDDLSRLDVYDYSSLPQFPPPSLAGSVGGPLNTPSTGTVVQPRPPSGVSQQAPAQLNVPGASAAAVIPRAPTPVPKPTIPNQTYSLPASMDSNVNHNIVQPPGPSVAAAGSPFSTTASAFSAGAPDRINGSGAGSNMHPPNPIGYSQPRSQTAGNLVPEMSMPDIGHVHASNTAGSAVATQLPSYAHQHNNPIMQAPQQQHHDGMPQPPPHYQQRQQQQNNNNHAHLVNSSSSSNIGPFPAQPPPPQYQHQQQYSPQNRTPMLMIPPMSMQNNNNNGGNNHHLRQQQQQNNQNVPFASVPTPQQHPSQTYYSPQTHTNKFAAPITASTTSTITMNTTTASTNTEDIPANLNGRAQEQHHYTNEENVSS